MSMFEELIKEEQKSHWMPGQMIDRETIQKFLAIMNTNEIKAELSKQIRVEMDNNRIKYEGKVQSYDSLTSGNVNAQMRMAASGYDVYGRTILSANQNASNNNVYKKMKNKIIYGANSPQSFVHRGSRSVV